MKRKRVLLIAAVIMVLLIALSLGYWLIFAGSQNVYKSFYGGGDVKFLFIMDNNTAGFPGFNEPLAVAAAGNRVYVADTNNNVVRVFDTNGKYITDIGKEGPAKLAKPFGLAISPDNKLYVGEIESQRITIFELDGRPFATQTMKQYSPGPMTFDSKGNLYVVDQSNQKINVYGSWKEDAKISFGSYGVDKGQFGFPRGLLVVDDKLYVADSNNFRIQIFDLKGNFVKMFKEKATTPDKNDTDPLSLPGSMVLDAKGRIMVTDVHNHKIRVYEKTGKQLYDFGEKGVYEGQFMYPAGIYRDGSRLYVTDRFNNRVQVFKITK